MVQEIVFDLECVCGGGICVRAINTTKVFTLCYIFFITNNFQKY